MSSGLTLKILHSCLEYFFNGPQNKQRLLLYTALTVRILNREELRLLCGMN
jgi:hypothetical protein